MDEQAIAERAPMSRGEVDGIVLDVDQLADALGASGSTISAICTSCCCPFFLRTAYTWVALVRSLLQRLHSQHMEETFRL